MITVLVPSRGRPELARRLRDTWNRTKRMPKTKIRFYLNDDDPHLNHYKQLINREEYVIGPDQATCFSWNMLAHHAISRGKEVPATENVKCSNYRITTELITATLPTPGPDVFITISGPKDFAKVAFGHLQALGYDETMYMKH